jgi:hypothetical protein
MGQRRAALTRTRPPPSFDGCSVSIWNAFVTQRLASPLQDRPGVRPARARDNLALAGAGRNEAFVGRTGDLARLATLVDDPTGPRAVVIVAGAGFGKTELAKAFLHAHATPATAEAGGCEGRWWLDGSAQAEAVSLSAYFPVITGHPVPTEPTPQPGADASGERQAWLVALRRRVAQACSEGRHLVVLDNAESADQIRDYRPTDAGRLIATTRRQSIPPATAAALSLDVLDAEDARALLTTGRVDLRALWGEDGAA